MIITGGFNVYSIEVEQALLQHPDVMDSAVFGLPDDKWGERVAAVVQLHAGRTSAADEIIAFVKARIGSVKAPKQVDIWPDLPRSKVGKVLKKEIRARLLAGAGARLNLAVGEIRPNVEDDMAGKVLVAGVGMIPFVKPGANAPYHEWARRAVRLCLKRRRPRL